MTWYYLAEAVKLTGKTDRTIRNYLKKWKEQNPNQAIWNRMFTYIKDELGVERLQVSDTFLQTYFNVQIHTPEKATEKQPEIHSDHIAQIDLEERIQKREETLRQYYEKQIADLTDAKQETIDVLKNQLDQANTSLNKVLEQYQLAQLTISNLIEPKKAPNITIESNEDIQEIAEATATEITDSDIVDEIIEQQQKPTGLSTTDEYLKKNKIEGTDKSFFDWLNNPSED